MNDIQVRVNYRTWQIIMGLWVALIITIVVTSFMPKYELPEIIMNFFMLVTGSVLLVFQAFEKDVAATLSITDKQTAALPAVPPAPPAPTPPTPDQISAKIQELRAIIAQSKQGGFATMKMLVTLLTAACLLLTGAAIVLADTTPVAPATTTVSTSTNVFTPGFGPAALASVGKFYLDGHASAFAAGLAVGTAYRWQDKSHNFSDLGIYVGPTYQSVGSTTTTTLDGILAMTIYENTVAPLTFGVGTMFWQNNLGMDKAISCRSTFLVLSMKFSGS